MLIHLENNFDSIAHCSAIQVVINVVARSNFLRARIKKAVEMFYVNYKLCLSMGITYRICLMFLLKICFVYGYVNSCMEAKRKWELNLFVSKLVQLAKNRGNCKHSFLWHIV